MVTPSQEVTGKRTVPKSCHSGHGLGRFEAVGGVGNPLPINNLMVEAAGIEPSDLNDLLSIFTGSCLVRAIDRSNGPVTRQRIDIRNPSAVSLHDHRPVLVPHLLCDPQRVLAGR